MHLAKLALVAALVSLAILAPASAVEPVHPVVAGFERFHRGPNSDKIRGGQLLLGELNCVSCHAVQSATIDRKQAPGLDRVGSRVRVGWLRKFLADPAAVKPGTTMPHLLAADAAKAEKVEALVHFLASTGTVRHERSDLKAIIVGRDHYQKLGCFACHGPRDALGRAERTTVPYFVPIGEVAGKYSVPGLAAFLEKPHETRPSGRMPSLVNAREARAIANYLLQGLRTDGPPRGSTAFAYYEGEWDKVPDFSKLKPALTGTSPAFEVDIARRGSNFALKFEGFFKVEKDGNYKFHLGSDDGSRLWVDGQLVTDNDGVHAPTFNQGRAYLKKGVHKVVVGFFQVGGGAEMTVEIEGGGIARQSLASMVSATEAGLTKPAVLPKKSNEDAIDLKPELIAKGGKLFASLGCANCHAMSVSNRQITPTLNAPSLTGAKDGGCLDVTPKLGLPNYGLSAAQRAALSSALAKPAPSNQTPADVLARTMTTFNCFACHSRGGVGGPEEEWNKLFLTSQPEMGDEGRVPPPLDGVGAKLNPEYCRQLLDKGVDDRPYMHTRMPGFRLANVGHLVPLLSELDKFPPAPAVSFNEPGSRVRSAGRHMVGSNGLSCIKCHTFAGNKAEGVQGIDMLLMPKRVRRDWFHAYLLDPQKIRPGTRMPSAWFDGKSPLPKVLDGNTKAQIEAIWSYLADSKPVLPIGLRKQSIPLTPLSEAIVYRNFIEGAGPRGIAVGYPERVHLAFDANDCRLAMIWQGEFIDAGRHWNDRGVGFEPPLGDNVVHLPKGAAFAELEKADASWPSATPKQMGVRFLGYRTSPDQRPTFLYRVGDISIEDFPNAAPTGKTVALKRSLTLAGTKAPANLYFRAAVGSKIEAANDGSFRVDGLYQLKITGGEARLRKSNGKLELLVRVRFTNGKAVLVQELQW